MEKNLTLIALFAALIAALGFLPAIMLPGGVPVTAQSLGIMLCGTVLGSKRGALAVILFLVVVALGVPALSGGRGGYGVFLGPSVGFLVGFPLVAFVAGLVVERSTAPLLYSASFGAFLGGMVVLYPLGALGWALMLGKTLPEVGAFLLGFVPGDLIKVVLAAFITRAVGQMRPAALLSRPL
jgi:biotin transport system substrate-specific component